MELRFAVVEDRLPDAQRLESLLRLAFGGGSGAGVNIQPVAFLVVKDGCVRTIQLSDGSNTIDRALTMLPELVDKVSALLKKEEKKDAAAPAAPAAEE